ncbi:MAG TPA: HAMP domain-containing sensor histidine kinase [Vicinamibacteria bacterium]|nr:HAMP domain-containing sensor histidine kinase [Vicinamibacteria bacterium]
MATSPTLTKAVSDPRNRLIALFVGAVLLPSIALSVVSFNSIPKHADALKATLYKQAEKVLYYVEKDLQMKAQAWALEAARTVGTEKLLIGDPKEIRAALKGSGMGSVFDVLRLEASWPVAGLAAALATRERDMDVLKEALATGESHEGENGEDSLPLTAPGGEKLGVLKFRFACDEAHRKLVREFFEKDFQNPDNAWVVWVAEADGALVYQTAARRDDLYEVKRVMSAPSVRGLRLYLRYKDRSIEQDVRRWALGKMALIGFIDVMLAGGLFLVYGNVQREMHLSRLKSDFVANVSHELKTPLALIRLFAETLELGRVPSDDKARQYYRVINKESQRLTQLINNILDFSRIEAGKKEYRFAPTDLARVVHEVVDAYRFQIEQQGFALELDVPEGLPEIAVDKEALGQALINLLNNAIKYSRDDKRIRIAVRVEKERVSICVADRGIGIEMSEQKKIFEKFYRAEDSLVHDTKGSGLGLSLVRHIMEAHGGSVQVESAPGSGSTFTLSLPIRGVA